MANLSAKITIQELPAAPAAIQGVSTSNVATAGWTKRGRTDQIVQAGSFAEWQQRLGTFWTNSYIPYCVDNYFDQDGTIAYTQRITPADAVVASATIGDAATTAVFTGKAHATSTLTGLLSASKYNIKIQVDAFAATTVDVTGNLGVSGSYTLAAIAANINTALTSVSVTLSACCSVVQQTTNGGTVFRLQFTSPSTGASSQIIFTAPSGTDATLVLLGIGSFPNTTTGLASAATRYTLTALGAGLWGNDLQMVIQGDASFTTTTGGWTKFDAFVNEELDGNGIFITREIYSLVALTPDTDPSFLPNLVTARSAYVHMTEGPQFGIPRSLTPIHLTNEMVGSVIGDGAVTTFSGRLISLPNRGTVTITAGAVTATDNGSGSLSGTGVTTGTVDYTTGEVSITYAVAPTASTGVYAAYYTTPASSATFNLTSGTDGTGPLTRSLVTDPTLSASSAGIYAFNSINDQVLNFILPDFAGSVAVANDLLAWADARKDVFVVLDPASGLSAQNIVQYVQNQGAFNSTRAAIYWPWPTIADPLTADGNPKNVPPSGFVVGVYARTDATRNVSKAPAGTSEGKLVNCIGFERKIPESDRDIVYPARINPFINETFSGRAVWGARTLSLDKSWRYIQARRFFMFVEKSVYVNSWWAVFETIGPDLFARLKTNGRSFLLTLLRNGYFPSKVEAQAFAIVCDTTNNTPLDSQSGQVNVDYFLAPSTPNEFLNFRFQQLVLSSS